MDAQLTTIDLVVEVTKAFGAMVGIVFAATEGIYAAFPFLKRERLRLEIGLITALIAQGLGYLFLPQTMWGWIGAGFFGIVTTAAAAVGSAYIVPAVTSKREPRHNPQTKEEERANGNGKTK